MTTPAKLSSSFLKKAISAKVKPSARLILGISGGPDSVALLHLLLEAGFRPILAHVNYHLRGRSSDLDQKLVEKLANQHGLELHVLPAHPKKLSGNLEANCRQLRYEFFETVRTAAQADAILTAHTLDDRVETFLLNLSRGASLRGFTSIQAWDDKRRLLRPLLEFPKSTLLNYLKTHHYTYRLDKSNADTKFSRNFIRHKIIPLFQKLNPNFTQTISTNLENLNENLNIIDVQTTTWLDQNLHSTPTSHTFPLDQFLQEPSALQKNLLRQLFHKLNDSSLTTHTLQEILHTLHKNRAGLRKEFGPGYNLQIRKFPTPNPRGYKRQVIIEALQISFYKASKKI